MGEASLGFLLFFILLNVLFVLFCWRIWQFMARHPIIRLLHDVSFQVDVMEEGELGEMSEMRTIHVRIRRTQ